MSVAHGELEMFYLIRITKGKIKEKAKAHYWINGDTACRMASTGGLNVARYDIFDSDMGKPICTMCSNVYNKPLG